ncbi:trypsin-like peptidase domain-containing protein [Verrucomicrobiota bacterium]
MNKSTAKWLISLLLLSVLAEFTGNAYAAFGRKSLRNSVVKIYATIQRADYSMPWQSGFQIKGNGTGFIIDKRRILTNAHIVSDVKFLQVQKNGDAKKYRARVSFSGHDCDLAILSVDDPSFFKGTSPVTFAKQLPRLNDEVTVLGYPRGGIRLSITRGIVSRIDYSTYSHSGIDQHLVLQVDAAINPGNSGGPIIFKDKVVGLAFQGLAESDNIGYAIPIPVINHFLEDIKDGDYNGYPELGASWIELHNIALHKSLGLPASKTGVAVYYLDPFGSAVNLLEVKDVLLSVDQHIIENDGTVDFNGNNVRFEELLEQKQWGESVIFKVWRNKKEIEVTVPLTNPKDPYAFRRVYDELPEYFMVGGLIFSPFNRAYLNTLRGNPGNNSQQLLYYSQYAKTHKLYEDRDEFVVLIRRLPHKVNTYANYFFNGIVTEINGIHICNIADIKKAINSPQNGFHVMRFAGMDDVLVLDATASKKVESEIMSSYGLSAPEYFNDMFPKHPVKDKQ